MAAAGVWLESLGGPAGGEPERGGSFRGPRRRRHGRGMCTCVAEGRDEGSCKKVMRENC